MKKSTEKKQAPAAKKSVKKTAKKPVESKAKKAVQPASKKAEKQCACALRDDKIEDVCISSLVSEIFSQLQDTDNLSNLMKDYFFTELLKRGIAEDDANAIANKIDVQIECFEANIDFAG